MAYYKYINDTLNHRFIVQNRFHDVLMFYNKFTLDILTFPDHRSCSLLLWLCLWLLAPVLSRPRPISLPLTSFSDATSCSYCVRVVPPTQASCFSCFPSISCLRRKICPARTSKRPESTSSSTLKTHASSALVPSASFP